MGFTLVGLALLASAWSYPVLLAACGLVGIGSSIFHPESSRVARTASGGRYGLAQSLFQVGGNTGQALGPLLAAAIVLPRGQTSVGWLCVVALAAMLILANVGTWARRRLGQAKKRRAVTQASHSLSLAKVMTTLVILGALMFSKAVYPREHQQLSAILPDRQISSHRAVGADLSVPVPRRGCGRHFRGRPDRRPVRPQICDLVLHPRRVPLHDAVAPRQPVLDPGVLLVMTGLILASAFSVILVYAQELLPGKVGLIAGLFFGLAASGLPGLGAAGLGVLADHTSIRFVYSICAWLPGIGLLAAFPPNLHSRAR